MKETIFGVTVMVTSIAAFYWGMCWFIFEGKEVYNLPKEKQVWTLKKGLVTVLGLAAVMTVVLSVMIVLYKTFPKLPLYQFSILICFSVFTLCIQLYRKMTGHDPMNRSVLLVLVALTVGSTVFLVSNQNWLTIDLSATVMAALFMHMQRKVTIGRCVAMSVGLLIYDAVAVFGTRQMIVMADIISSRHGSCYGFLVVPQGLALSQSSYVLRVGLGDIVLPAMIVLAAYNTFGKQRANWVIIGDAVGLVITVIICKAFNSPQPATIYLIPMSFLGLWIGSKWSQKSSSTAMPSLAAQVS